MVTKLKEILEPASRVKPFYRWLNLWDVDPDDGVLIGVDGSFTSCYELESLPDIIHKTREEQADFLSMLGRALAVLPDETVLVLRVSGREGADFKKIKDYELSSFKKDEEGEL